MSKEILKRAAALFFILTLLCGIIYTAVITGISQLLFPAQANGSIIEIDGVSYGSSLIGQPFTGEEYLWGRPMSLDCSTFTDTEGKPLLYAGPSNTSPASDAYEALIAERVDYIRVANPAMGDMPIPVELVTESGSGLDPHISPKAAAYQVKRIASARGISEEQVEAIIEQYTDGKFLGVFGERTVNVLEVNLALDGMR